MRCQRACSLNALVLSLILMATSHAHTSEKIVVDGSTGVMPLVSALAKAYQERHRGVTVEVGKGLGTKARLRTLAEGRIDIALASHGLDLDELRRRGMAAYEIGKVAVVFGVNKSVPVTNVSEVQICDIFAGRVTNWKELGGPDLPIAPRTRPDSEVDVEVVRGTIGCLRDLKMPEAVKVMPRSGDMARELAASVGAIGMTTTAVVEQSRGEITPLSLNGIFPTVENVERKTYPLVREAFLVTKAPVAPAVSGFIEFIRSSAGEVVIVANGAVPGK